MAKNTKKKILVVDDDPSILKLAKSILTQAGYEVATAADGIDGMVQVKEQKPDFIVLDVMMPELNGYDVCHKLKFDSPFKDIPILLLTARDEELDPRVGEMMGISYLQKPINREVLLAQIKQILK